jgi:anti-sigma-K factor RskA
MLAFAGQEAPPELWERIVANLEEKPPPLELARVIPTREPAWRRVGVRMLAAAAVVISVVALAVSLTGTSTNDDPTRTVIATVLADPATKLVHLVSAEGAVRAEVAMLGGKGYLISHRLPELSDDKTYQLWAVSGERKISLGTLGNAPRAGEFAAAGDFDALAVTVERQGGAPAPTTNPVAAGTMPVA